MKKILIVGLVIVVFVAYVIYIKIQGDNNKSQLTSIPNITNPQATAPASSLYKDGTYTGIVADAFYGNIQVSAVITGGKIIDIKFLQYPDKKGHTTEVSNMALPILKDEAIKVQSAHVDNVTGATQTTDGFKVTLQSALDKAKIS